MLPPVIHPPKACKDGNYDDLVPGGKQQAIVPYCKKTLLTLFMPMKDNKGRKGPYRVVRLVGPTPYWIQRGRGAPAKYHVDQLRPHQTQEQERPYANSDAV
ncbi:hypothetical protein Trydic_g13783 [Trypoxylus dichotomus]